MNKRLLFLLSVFLLSISALLFLRSASGTPSLPGKEDGLPPSRNCFVTLPPHIDFAGEPVPLNDQEVFERLDREVHVNTYFHSSTIQLVKLSSRWFPLIEKILHKNGVPDDFKYLAAAESGLRNVISTRGARGIWQLMPGTAKEYGLIVNREVDERYNIEKSTDAACQYLKKAYEKLGSWTLAAASYNMGMDGIESEMTRQEQNNYYNLLLNSETSRYMFRILALKTILSDPAKYGFCYDASDLYEPLQYKSITVDTAIHNLVHFAKQQNTSYKMLKYLNPWLRKNTLKEAEEQAFDIKIPAS